MSLKEWQINGWLKPHRASKSESAVYLEACRVKRNTVEYDMAGAASESEAAELLQFAKELREEVLNWLQKNHPQWLP